MLTCFFFFALFLLPVNALFYRRFQDLPVKDFDFIVVGGGTAGNVVANRLSEDPRIRVLVLEAGGSDKDAFNSHVPLYGRRLQGSQFDWNFTTTPQAALNNRPIAYPRGFIIGGSSSINLMVYTRGPSEDWDRMARVTGDSGWNWDNIQSFIRKNERFVPPADHHNTTGQFTPSVHGFHGVNSVSLSGWRYSSDPRVLEAMKESGGEFRFNEDMNSGFHLGFGWTQTTVGHGTRSSSSTSYLGPQYINRKNLFVLLNTRVLRVKQTHTSSKTLVVRGVEFTQNSGKTTHTLQATKELILSAGSIGTPTILMHSGIGDPNELTPLNIKTLHALPSVGKNLTDHPLLVTNYNANTTDTTDDILRNATFAAPFERTWNETRTGPLSSTQGRILGWFRFNLSESVFEGVDDPAAGPNSAHYEVIIGNGAGNPPPTGHFLALTMAVVSPTSAELLKSGASPSRVNSSNPLAPPLINPNILGTTFDFTAMREAFFATQRFISAPSFNGYITAPAFNVTDATLDDFIRNNTGVIWHPVKTAAMSARGADHGVVDPDLKVKGLEGLRIVDASVLPFIPTAHTQAPTYIIAERAAALIKEEYGLN